MQKIQERFIDDLEVAIIAVQTTFEGFGINTFGGVKQMIETYGLKIPVGQSGSRNAPSILMRNYRTGGTPWVVIIDKKGIVRFNDFHVSPDKAIPFMEQLKRL